MKNKLYFLIFLFFLYIFIVLNNVFGQCYYENNYDSFNFEIYCINGRDIQIKNLNISDLSLSKIFETTRIDNFIFAKKNNKNSLLALEFDLNRANIFEYDYYKKKFVYIGSYYKGFVDDLENDGNYEIVYSNPLNENKIYIKKQNNLLTFNLEENETLLFVMNKFIFTLKHINLYNFTLNIYKLVNNNLRKFYSINLTLSELNDIRKFFVYDNQIFVNYKYDWYHLNDNNISNWDPVYFYQRDSLSFVNLDVSNGNFYLNIPSYSFFKSFSFDNNKDSIYSIVRNFNWKGKREDLLFVFYYNLGSTVLDVYDIKNSTLVKTYNNISFFQAYKDKLFFSINEVLYYTDDFYNSYILLNLSQYFDNNNYDLNIKRFYLFDLDNDNIDEIIILTNDLVLIFDNSETPQVDYYIKEVSFPEPYTTYRNYFNVTICSKGNQIIPFNLSISVFHNQTKLKSEYSFENIFLHANSCKTFKINYLPYKKGNINVRVSIIVEDKDKDNNELDIEKDVLSDFYSLDVNFDSFRKKMDDPFLFVDSNDDLKDGYENLIINYSKIKNLLNLDFNLSNSEICKYLNVDYNRDNISEYLLDCSFYDYYLTLDPLNQLIINTSHLQEEDFEFYVGLFNNNYTVILPWKNYTGYVETLKKDENDLDVILVDYNLDNIYDFLIYPWALEKEVLDYKIIGKNLKPDNILINTYYDPENNKLIKEINFDLLYKGLFNITEAIPISVFGKELSIEVSENPNSNFYIPLSRTPYSDFNSLKVSHTIEDFNINSNEIKINYPDYNPLDNNVSVNFCYLSIKKINLKPDNSYIELNKSCEDPVELEIYSNKSLIHSENTQDTLIYLNNSLLNKDMTFVVFYKDKLEFNYRDNIRNVIFDLNKLIQVDFLKTDFTLFVKDNLEFKVICKKGLDLKLNLECRANNITFQENFYCENEKNFSLEVLFDKVDSCKLKLSNENNEININLNLPLNFDIPKEIKRVKVNGKSIIILEIKGEKKAYIIEEKKLVDICEKNIGKKEFSAEIKLNEGCLNVVNIEVPEFLTVLEISTNGTATKIGNNKYIVYTFDKKISFKTKSVIKVNESAKEKYNIVEENREKDRMEFIKKIAVFLSIGSFVLFMIVAISYYLYVLYQKKVMETKRMKMIELQKLKEMKEKEKRKRMIEIIKMKREKLIEDEARKLLTWLRFLLSTYDEKEIREYLLKKGYEKEVVEKAFELYKKGSY